MMRNGLAYRDCVEHQLIIMWTLWSNSVAVQGWWWCMDFDMLEDASRNCFGACLHLAVRLIRVNT